MLYSPIWNMNVLVNMKVLCIGNFLSRSYQAPSEILANELSKKGLEFSLASHFNYRLPRVIHMLYSCLTKSSRHDVAIIDVFSGPAFHWALACAWILHKLKCPVVLFLHGGNLPSFALSHPHRVKKLFSYASAIVAPSQYLAAKLEPYTSKKFVLIPNGIDFDSYQVKVEKQEKSIIWVRAFHRIYNPNLLIEALALLKKELKEFGQIKVTMVGRDKDGTLLSVINKVKDFQLEETVEIIPGIPKKDIPAILSDKEIFVNTTHVDNTPVSVIEAMAAKCAVISTNVGGIPYLLENRKDALLFQPGNAQDLKNALKEILCKNSMRDEMGTQALKKAKKMDWSFVCSEWLALLTALTSKG
ncbi:MAG: hypothetical protein CR997_09570 [Acidobacteria bacterium]|nr:MAG: hypothetical protein CR997_09570 [Acidobacteriota bacterium]